MSTDTNEQTAREFFESVDEGGASASQALLTADFTAHLAGNERAMNARELLEGPLVLATLLRRADFELIDPRGAEAEPSATLRPRGGLPMRVRPRAA